MEKKYILVIDEGTTGVRAFIFDRQMKIVGEAYEKIQVLYTGPSEVEENGEEIYRNSVKVCRDAVNKAGISAEEIASVGIAVQRLSWLFWDKETGKPLRNIVTWLDTRGVYQKQKWIDDPDFNKLFPGLAPYLPGLYMPLIFDRIKDKEPAFAEAMKKPNVLYGTIDTWLIWKLTNGQVHATVGSCASNTTNYVLESDSWNIPMLGFVGIRPEMMPEIKEESDDFGMMSADVLGVEIPIFSAFADQQSAVFSQACLEPNTVKCTNGTGIFVDVNIGLEAKQVGSLTTSIAWTLDGETMYMAEGFSATAGACLEWAKNQAELIADFSDLDLIEESTPNSEGVFFVPALTGLTGAPVADQTAKAGFLGISGKTTKDHMVRAIIEGVAFAASSLIEKAKEASIQIKEVKVSGGVSKNNVLCQTMSNVVNAPVIRPESIEATALGAAEMAAIKLGWIEMEDVKDFLTIEKTFYPDENQKDVSEQYNKWKKVVDRVLNWEN